MAGHGVGLQGLHTDSAVGDEAQPGRPCGDFVEKGC